MTRTPLDRRRDFQGEEPPDPGDVFDRIGEDVVEKVSKKGHTRAQLVESVSGGVREAFRILQQDVPCKIPETLLEVAERWVRQSPELQSWRQCSVDVGFVVDHCNKITWAANGLKQRNDDLIEANRKLRDERDVLKRRLAMRVVEEVEEKINERGNTRED